MALSFQGVSLGDINWGLIKSIEVRPQGSGSFVSVGEFVNAKTVMNVLVDRGDPSNMEYPYAVEYMLTFDLLQTAAAAELAMISATPGTGLYTTDVEIKITYATGRTITLGTQTTAPCRIIPAYDSGGDGGAQLLPCRVSNIESLGSLPGKVA